MTTQRPPARSASPARASAADGGLSAVVRCHGSGCTATTTLQLADARPVSEARLTDPRWSALNDDGGRVVFVCPDCFEATVGSAGEGPEEEGSETL